MPPGGYYATLARARQGAGALITTNDGRVVMIDTTYRDFYEIPGGALNSGKARPRRAYASAAKNWALRSPSDDCWRWIISATVVKSVTRSCTSTTADQLSRRCS